MTTNALPDADTLAAEFTSIIREWLTPEELKEIDARNAVETDSNICHSHDFCDPNQALIDAFARFNIELGPQDDEHCKLIDAAWTIAKAGSFGTHE